MMRRCRAIFLSAIALVFLAASMPAHAVQPDEVLDDPVLEERARGISANLRCMVCQNQSIDDSDAELARDLRVLVRDRLVAGDSNEEVVGFVVSRYGEFVLLKPRFSARNALLWGAPILLLLGGIAVILASSSTRRTRKSASLTEDENKALQKILQERD